MLIALLPLYKNGKLPNLLELIDANHQLHLALRCDLPGKICSRWYALRTVGYCLISKPE